MLSVLCHPVILRSQLGLSSSAISWGAQNSFPEPLGAYTGELSAEMISDFGGECVGRLL